MRRSRTIVSANCRPGAASKTWEVSHRKGPGENCKRFRPLDPKDAAALVQAADRATAEVAALIRRIGRKGACPVCGLPMIIVQDIRGHLVAIDDALAIHHAPLLQRGPVCTDAQ